MNTTHGEHIPLYWDWDPTHESVRGHVSSEEGRAALAKAGYDTVNYQPPSHEYGRWSVDASAPDGISQILVIYKERGRGRFPITVYRPLEKKPDV